MEVVESSACLRPCGVVRGSLQQDGGRVFCHALVVGLSGVRVRLWLDGNDDELGCGLSVFESLTLPSVSLTSSPSPRASVKIEATPVATASW